MKKLKLYSAVIAHFIGTLTFANPKPEPQFSIIKGEINFEIKQDSIMLFNVVDGQMNRYTTTKLNSDKKFGFSVPITKPGFFYIDYGQMRNNRKDQLIRLYLEPDLDFELKIQEKDYELSGKLGHNKLVQKANDIYDSYAHYLTLGKPNTSYKTFYPFIENEAPKALENFKKTINTKDKTFNTLLKLAVETDYEVALYDFFHFPKSEHSAMNDRPSVYAKYKKPSKFSNPDLLLLGNGFQLIDDYFYYYSWQEGTTSEKLSMTERIKYNVATITYDKSKEIYLLEILKKGYLKPFQYQEIKSLVNQYLVSQKSKDFLVGYEKDLHNNIGQPGFDFTYNNVEGKQVSFSDFKGKYVYIDVWATWCAPCKKEIPHLKELEEDYRDKDIVFMSISIDQVKDEQKWKDFVKSEELKGVQLMADKDFKSGITENYDINAIPRFLLFDKEGKIVSTDAIRPSNPEIRNQFNELLDTPAN